MLDTVYMSIIHQFKKEKKSSYRESKLHLNKLEKLKQNKSKKFKASTNKELVTIKTEIKESES